MKRKHLKRIAKYIARRIERVAPHDKPGDAPSPVAPPGAVDAAVPDGWVVLEWSMSCLGYRGLWHPSKMRDADGGVWYRDGVGGDR